MSYLDQKVSLCESIIEYTFADRLLCAVALNTTGNMVLWDNQFRVVPKNQRLSVYGDSVVAASLCRKWFETDLAKGMLKWSASSKELISTRLLDDYYSDCR
jgi:hypothetical protein